MKTLKSELKNSSVPEPIETVGRELTPAIRTRNSRLRVPQPVIPTPSNLLTQQQFADECDMNLIVAKAQKGIPPRFLAKGVPQFGDFSAVPNLTDAYNRVRDAEDAFMNLPAQLRLELGNDPRNIGNITRDQADRFKLLRDEPTPSKAVSASSSVGQTEKAGTEPAKTPKVDKNTQDS